MGWRIVEVTQEDYLQLYLNNLLIKRPQERIMFNLADLDVLLLNNDRVKLSARLLNALTENNISVVLTNVKHMPASLVLPVQGHHMSLKILQKQINWTHEYKSSIWQEIVRNKISNQASVLRQVTQSGCSAQKLGEFVKATRPYDVTNREGHAAKVYWHNLFGLKFVRDHTCFHNPLLNAMLNYGYAVLRALVSRSIVKKGLDPRISVFHKTFSNFFALASDFMEPFRPVVDRIVFKNKNTTVFSVFIREEIIKALTQKVKVRGKEQYLNNAVDMMIDNITVGKGHLWIGLCV